MTRCSGTATFGDAAGEWSGSRSAANSGASAGRTDGRPRHQRGLAVRGELARRLRALPTITFNQSGEKLTGQYVGQLGEAPIQGTLKGSELTFSLDVSVPGHEVHIVYTGTATKDALKGTASFGDLGEGTFTARRK